MPVPTKKLIPPFVTSDSTEKDSLNTFNLPTAEDSAALYNNTLALLKFYNTSNDYELTSKQLLLSRLSNPNITRANLNDVKEFSQNASQPLKTYYKPVDKNKYYKREKKFNVLNMNAPMALYDKRIKPTVEYSFIETNPEFKNTEQEYNRIGKKIYESEHHAAVLRRIMNRDLVNFYGYDPVQIKPFHMLTPKEKIARKKLEMTPEHIQAVKEQHRLTQPSTNNFTKNQKELLLKQKQRPEKPTSVEDSVFVPSTPVAPKTVDEIVTPYGKMTAESYKKQFGQKAYERDFKVKK